MIRASNDPIGQLTDSAITDRVGVDEPQFDAGGGEWKCFEDDGDNPSRDYTAQALPKDKRIANDNYTCARPCTKIHEEQHESDLGKCCEKAQAAWNKAKRANDTVSMSKIKARWRKYRRENYWGNECRAYGASLQCARDTWRARCNHMGEDGVVLPKAQCDCCIDSGNYLQHALEEERRACREKNKYPPQPCEF